MKMQEKTRDYVWDNYKTILIITVVISHLIDLTYKNNELLFYIKWGISFFHMPAFIFVSGYFSKKKMKLIDVCKKLLIPYLVFEVIYYFLYIYILGKETKLYLLYPKFTLWYLLALFVWKIVTPYIVKVPYHLPMSIVGGILIGFSDMSSNYLSIPRIIVFLPFFILGYKWTEEHTIGIRESKYRTYFLWGTIFLSVTAIMTGILTTLPVKTLYGRYNYEYLQQTMIEGGILRMLFYVFGFGITLFILSIISNRRLPFSYMGQRTLQIYLFHGLIVAYLKHNTDLLLNIDTYLEADAILLSGVLLTLFLSHRYFTVVLEFLLFQRKNGSSKLHMPKKKIHLDYKLQT